MMITTETSLTISIFGKAFHFSAFKSQNDLLELSPTTEERGLVENFCSTMDDNDKSY